MSTGATALDYLGSLVLSARLAATKRAPPPATAPVRRLLILGYAAIGDMLFFFPVLEALRRRYPEAQFTFLSNASPITGEILPAAGLVDDIWLCDWEEIGAAAARPRINRRIAEGGFDAAVLTLSSPAHYFQAGLAAIPLRVGHIRPFEPVGLANSRLRLRRALVTGEPARRAVLNAPVSVGAASEYAVTRNLRLLEPFGLTPPSPAPKPSLLTPELRAWAREQLAPLGPKTKVAVHLGPARNQYHKIWDHERFGRLCARLTASFPVELVVVGGVDEEAALAAARKHSPLPHSWVGRASVLQTFALIESCALFIGNDTGLAKAAMSLGTPTATIWGPTDPGEVGAPWDAERHLDIRTGIGCSPCVRLGMAKEGVLNYSNCGHHDCLGRLETDYAFGLLSRKYAAVFGAR